MKKLALLALCSLVPITFVAACDSGNTPPPGPQGAPSSGIIPQTSITEAQKGEAVQNVGQLKKAIQSLAVQPRYRGKMDQLARDIGGPLTDATARAMGFAGASGFNSQWYKSTDYAVEYMGNGKWWIHAKAPADPAYVTAEVVIR